MDQTRVAYYDGQSSRPISARILVFQDAVQVYDTGSNDFLAAFPLNGVRLLSRSASTAYFSLQADGARTLEVPVQHLLLPELTRFAGGDKDRWFVSLSRMKFPAIIAVFLLVVVGFYFLIVSGISGIGMKLVSPKKEAELGRMLYETIVPDSSIDRPSTRALNDFAAPLKLSEHYQLQFTVVKDTLVNAFALPGGHIVVYQGILRKMETPGELVALLGHEASHVNERHSLRNILQELTGSFMLSLVFGDLGSIGGGIASQANKLRGLSYSRKLEEEADEEGMKRMLQNRVDPNGMLLLMDRLEAASQGPELPGFLSTHPLTADRKEHARRFIKKNGSTQPTQPQLEESWQQLKAVSR